jgi:DNA-binding transcriptional regulator YhcF (GntR family)
VKIEGEFEAETLQVLRDIPGLAVVARPRLGEHRPDATLRFADREEIVAVEIKRRANAATAWQLVQYAQLYPETPMLLIAGETTRDARQILTDHGIGFIDGLQNAHVELPGLMFHIEGRKRQRGAPGAVPPTRLKGKAGVAAQALLLQPDRVWTVRDLAAEAGIAAGLAHRVLARLEKEGIVAVEGTGPRRVRRVANPTALLDLWAEEQVDRPRRTLGYFLAQTPQQLIERLGTNLDRAGVDYALTGAAGASLLAPFVTAIPVTEVWVAATAAREELLQGAGADPVTDGQNVVFLQEKDNLPLAFREQTKGVWIANRFRLFADLHRDPRRGREQADYLRLEVIGF